MPSPCPIKPSDVHSMSQRQIHSPIFCTTCKGGLVRYRCAKEIITREACLVGIFGVDIVLDCYMALFPKIVGRNLHEVGYLRLSAARRVSTMDWKYGKQFADQNEHFCCVPLLCWMQPWGMYPGGDEWLSLLCQEGEILPVMMYLERYDRTDKDDAASSRNAKCWAAKKCKRITSWVGGSTKLRFTTGRNYGVGCSRQYFEFHGLRTVTFTSKFMPVGPRDVPARPEEAPCTPQP